MPQLANFDQVTESFSNPLKRIQDEINWILRLIIYRCRRRYFFDAAWNNSGYFQFNYRESLRNSKSNLKIIR